MSLRLHDRNEVFSFLGKRGFNNRRLTDAFMESGTGVNRKLVAICYNMMLYWEDYNSPGIAMELPVNRNLLNVLITQGVREYRSKAAERQGKVSKKLG